MTTNSTVDLGEGVPQLSPNPKKTRARSERVRAQDRERQRRCRARKREAHHSPDDLTLNLDFGVTPSPESVTGDCDSVTSAPSLIREDDPPEVRFILEAYARAARLEGQIDRTVIIGQMIEMARERRLDIFTREMAARMFDGTFDDGRFPDKSKTVEVSRGLLDLIVERTKF